jgi:hypothetical protein
MTAANAAVIAVEMRRPNAAAFNRSQTDVSVLRGGITAAKQHNIAKRSESQIYDGIKTCDRSRPGRPIAHGTAADAFFPSRK